MTISEIRKGLYDELKDNASIKLVLGDPARIYNRVPANPTKPYAVIRNLTDTPWDTIGAVGNESTFTVDVYNDDTNDSSVEDIGDLVKLALHRQSITATSTTVVMCVYETGGMVADPDPKVQHYTSRYRVKSNPA